MRRFWLFAVVMGMAVFYFFGPGAYLYVTNRQLTRLSCQEYLSTRSKAKWVELTECQVDCLNAVKVEDAVTKSDTGTYVPIRPPKSAGQASILLKMKTEEVQKQIAALTAPTAPYPPPEIDRTIKGLIETGDDKTNRAIQKTGVSAAEFVILNEGQAPSALGVVVIGAFWIVIIGAMLFVMMRAPSAKPEAASSESHGTPPSA